MPGNSLLRPLAGLDLLAEGGADDEVPPERIEALVEELRGLFEKPECLQRLHEVEQLMANDVLKEHRHLKCNGCVRWLTALIMKAQGKEWR